MAKTNLTKIQCVQIEHDGNKNWGVAVYDAETRTWSVYCEQSSLLLDICGNCRTLEEIPRVIKEYEDEKSGGPYRRLRAALQ